MRYGMCMGIDSPQNIKIAKDAGFDYMESGFSYLSQAEDEIVARFADALASADIRCEAANCFLPSDLAVIGNDYYSARFTDFIEKGMERGKKLGLEVVAFGSGAARRIPEGISYAEGFRQLGDFLGNVVSPIAEKYGITMVIEPLRKNETNIINTVKEGAMLAVLSGKDNVAGLADLYHMVGVGDTNDDIRQLKGSVKHAHFSNPSSHAGLKRGFPKSFEEFDYRSFIDALESIGCERCSVEARCTDYPTETAESGRLIEMLRKG